VSARETCAVITEQSVFFAINGRVIQHTKRLYISNDMFLSCGRTHGSAPTVINKRFNKIIKLSTLNSQLLTLNYSP